MKWVPALQLVAIGFYLQVPGCYPSCLIVGSTARCSSQRLRRIPALPPHITHLYLEMNHIREIHDTSLTGLEQLQELDLGMQYVPLVIRNNAFSKQRNLTKLVLSFNVGLQLEPDAFVGLSNLQALHLDYCSLQDSILEDSYLQPLSSLETLNLFGNQMKRLRPAPFFSNLTNFRELNLKLNQIDMICEAELIGFQGKHFHRLNLDSIRLKSMFSEGFNWEKCGNPFRAMTFQKLDLSHNGFSVGRSRQFFRAIEGTKIANLKLSGPLGKGFSHNNLLDPDHSTFEGLKYSSIYSLDLSKNYIFALQQRVFSPLRETAIIDVSQNKVNQIHRNAFDGLQEHLKVLNLSHNLLGEIYSHTFAALTNLKVLDLSHNHIGALGYRSFSGLPNLRMLQLTGNSLRELGFPASLPSLHYLFLNDNRLRSSSVGSLIQFASNSTYLNIEDNRLTNLEDVYNILTQLKHLQHLSYGGNLIKWCTLNRHTSIAHSNNLQTLDLHSSFLQTIWAQGKCLNLFDNLENLVGLNLSFNSLQSLPQGIFKGLSSVELIDLSSNALTYLQPDIFPRSLKRLNLSNNFIASPNPTSFRSLSFIDLAMNRFHCNPNLKSFLTWLNETNVTFLSPVEELRCEFPSDLLNVPLLDYSVQLLQK
ncbi:toll-like receptor 5 [Myripristis murdjan]|uniref:toll-like receptor 5 n=1 Tax=Myripristis murdjan TaxID=586833 RepID=UPI001175E500|nr:toll-like receptor 5 [Myripristis murdjan]